MKKFIGVVKGIWCTIVTLLAGWGILVTYIAIKEDWQRKARNWDAVKNDYDFETKATKKKK